MVVLTATPGPGVFATVAKSLSSGFVPASRVVFGIVLGDLVFLTLAMLGLGIVAETLGDTFVLLRWAGALYLIWLGCRLWASPSAAALQQTHSASGGFVSGLLLTLGNPKVMAFYVGFLPTFVDLAHLSLPDIALVASVVSGVLLSVLLAYAYAASYAGGLVRSPLWARSVSRASGATMMGTGAAVATHC
jgi:threonine/homoserine/homoserine lactone efflux protein